MPVLHVLSKESDYDHISYIINVDELREIKTQYKRVTDGEKTIEMEFNYKNAGISSNITIDNGHSASFILLDNLGEVMEMTSKVVDIEKALMKMMAIKEFERIDEEEYEDTENKPE